MNIINFSLCIKAVLLSQMLFLMFQCGVEGVTHGSADDRFQEKRMEEATFDLLVH